MELTIDIIIGSNIQALADELDEGRNFSALKHHQLVPWRVYEEDPMICYALNRLTHFPKNGISGNALQVASSIGDDKAVQMLFSRGANVNA